jgi:hypothetical protein
MQLISKALEQKKITKEQLSVDLQEEIQDLQNMIKTYNEACDEFEQLTEPDAETEKELDDMEHQIVTLEKDIADRINDEVEENKEVVLQSDTTKVTDKKESSSVGWLIFGGLALVATLGVVNVWKKNK